MNLTGWRTYLVTQSDRSAGRDTEEIVEAAIDGGVDAVQLREKGRSARDRYELGCRLREVTAAAEVPLLVNDRIDLAAAIDADGVHLGQSDLPIEIARERLGSDAIVGCSTSTVAEAEAAEAAGADYLGVGAVYGTASKDVPAEKNGIGTEPVATIADAVEIPVFGIGGITADNVRPVIEAGATGAAVISAITAADDPAAATAALDEVIADAR
ncbi:thiamine phosphate synthase [Halorubrum laminariae]|uniref:Thiamine-phosphate synthase n=1 Tax=Halorubrum laminariae TaxID=1433523 RepID=A0ABD6BX58_9EURY|nr:thiamine phosphate synthase [Halorubrum laminariae]